MSDYKEMYYELLRETEKAIRLIIEKGKPYAAAKTLIDAQRSCEELFLSEECREK